MAVPIDLTFGLAPRIIEKQTNERRFLSAMFVLLYVSYGALGRDVFFNHLDTAMAASEDPIGLVLPYIRAFACISAISVIVLSSGLTWGLSKAPLMFAPFCFMALASTAWTGDEPKEILRNSLVLTMAWIAWPMIIHRLGLVQTVGLTLYVIATVCILSALLAVFVPSVGMHTGTEAVQQAHTGRWRGIFAHKNGLGPWAAYGSLFLFTHSWLCPGRALFWWFARICAVACLIFSGSTTSLVLFGFVFTGWIVLLLLRRYPLKLVVLLFGFGLLFLCAGLVIFQEQLFALVGRDASLTGRTDIWAFAWEYFLEAMWFGHGYQSLGGEAMLAKEASVFLQPIPGAESGYLTLLLDLGLIGFALFFVPFFIAIRNGFQWMRYVCIEDRAALELLLLILGSTLIEAVSESNSLVSTGFDGVIAFTAYFALLTTPKAPDTVHRSPRTHEARGERTIATRSRGLSIKPDRVEPTLKRLV